MEVAEISVMSGRGSRKSNILHFEIIDAVDDIA
jgi:hypothetical protein